jgi:hypothetical protein
MHISKYIPILMLVLIFAFTASDATACHHPPMMVTYHKRTTCYGFVRQVLKERKDGRWHYYIREVLTELPCPRK